jgi:hypothetical protein
VGDKVTWTHKQVLRSGATVRLSTKEGIVKEIIRELAMVKPIRGGRSCAVLISRLTPMGQKSEIGRIFEAIASNVE